MTKISLRQRRAFAIYTTRQLYGFHDAVGNNPRSYRKDGQLTLKAIQWGETILKEIQLREAGIPLYRCHFAIEPKRGWKRPGGWKVEAPRIGDTCEPLEDYLNSTFRRR